MDQVCYHITLCSTMLTLVKELQVYHTSLSLRQLRQFLLLVSDKYLQDPHKKKITSDMNTPGCEKYSPLD